ncbi:PREDICTED: uncharacterized protein LOC105361745 [Ceratosolen solmsi marchali]|uniref:Uncharacterized protein LOC105361745 n=1 Tax=Ceratosolen solmsi marchali TaxID=326594 RepID=A0AAJ6YFW0_9HYME|nr:PREDICTED: uncharacterized protein LOC105361745 [Ceratosolen solmsi marchali]
MDSVKSAKDRFRKYPALLLQCRESAAAYANCVLNKKDFKKDDCKNEFDQFKSCLMKAAAQHKTKL